MDFKLKNQALPKLHLFLLLFIYISGLLVIYFEYFNDYPTKNTFSALYILTFIFAPPKKAISPLSIFYIYYGLWFVIAPQFAERFQGNLMELNEYIISFALAYSVFGLGVISMIIGEWMGIRFGSSRAIRQTKPGPSASVILRTIYLLYISSTAFVILIIQNSGGYSVWVADPGAAFLNRAGSGVYVILSHFSSIILAVLSGYYAYTQRQWFPLFLFIGWIAVTSPVHGSKFQISLLLILSLLPWLRTLKLFSFGGYLLGLCMLSILFIGLYFRNLTWIDAETFIPYVLNYFNTLENLSISIRDFSPSGIKTFFLPFNKFLTPFGLNDSAIYYDMNHFLTDIYFPESWAIRATEQWPVETDLYLNFYFIFGLPLVGLFLYLIAAIYGIATKSDSLGAWFAAIILTLFMISHLRGSLINHMDFYMYPYIAVVFYIFRNFYFEKIQKQ